MADDEATTTGSDAGYTPPAKATWETQLEIVMRLAIIVVGIPAVWVLRGAGVIHLGAWPAVGLSVTLLLVALGSFFVP